MARKKLTVAMYESAVKIGEKLGIKKEASAGVFFAVMSENASLASAVSADLGVEKEIFASFLDSLLKEGFIDEKNFSSMLKNFKGQGKGAALKKNIEKDLEEIFEHFSFFLQRSLRKTKKREDLIKKWLLKGFSKKDFMMVHMVFHEKWAKNPEMSQYFRMETLYNNKFPDRVIESKEYMETINEFEEDIRDIIDSFYRSYMTAMGTEFHSVDYKNDLSIQKRIAHWLSIGYTKNKVKGAIIASVTAWSKKEELHPFITLEKILDEKFPERCLAAERVFSKTRAVSPEEMWLKKKNGEIKTITS